MLSGASATASLDCLPNSCHAPHRPPRAQVLRVCRALSRTGGLRFRSAAATGGRPLRTQREALEGGVRERAGSG